MRVCLIGSSVGFEPATLSVHSHLWCGVSFPKCNPLGLVPVPECEEGPVESQKMKHTATGFET